MQVDRSEWEELQRQEQAKNKRKGNGSDHLAVFEMLHQASVKQEQLTNDDNWNYYLTLIQEWINKTKQHAEDFRIMLESPDFVNADERKRLENHLLRCNERIVVLEATISLPNEIIKSYQDAQLHLEEIGKQNIEDEAET